MDKEVNKEFETEEVSVKKREYKGKALAWFFVLLVIFFGIYVLRPLTSKYFVIGFGAELVNILGALIYYALALVFVVIALFKFLKYLILSIVNEDRLPVENIHIPMPVFNIGSRKIWIFTLPILFFLTTFYFVEIASGGVYGILSFLFLLLVWWTILIIRTISDNIHKNKK